jgi:hypothetical protein
MPVKRLPPNPSVDHLKHQAKDLLKAHSGRAPAAAQRLREFHPGFLNATDADIFTAALKLSDAQLAIARERGFPRWSRLKSHIEKPDPSNRLDLPRHERIEDPVFRRAVDLLDVGDVVGLRDHLKQHPSVARQRVAFEGVNYFRNPTLFEFIAENPIRHETMPPNIADVAQVILDAGVEQVALDETLMLVATGARPRKCRLQVPLIDLLCRHGADPSPALQAAVLHEELEAATALIACGGHITLPVAAGLGRFDDFNRLFLSATSEERHLALTMAADLGHFEIVKLLLDAGEDPDRYNPTGSHSHATPLHQATWRGYENIVRLFVERGARLDTKDLLWNGTPADWAMYAGRTELVAYLRAHEAKKK